ncbi:exonuclease SbcCD subunit D [Paradesulfitobacterium aromaticivorans]
MRILHTSDWHLGRMLEGRSRLEEQVKFIDELCRIVEKERVELVLIAGDVFDTVNPPAAAEELFYEALDRLAAGGKRAVVAIAGNHDNPDRLCAASPLAVRHGITLFGLSKEILSPSVLVREDRVYRAAAGQGWVKLHIPNCPDPVVIAMLPYPSESRLNEVLSESLDEEILRAEYSRRVGQFWAKLAENFEADAVNLGVSHIYVRGGLESDSERPIQLGGAPTVEPEMMPAGAHYVALGHLHRPQAVKAAPVPTRYAGSPLAYSFSETGYAKSVMLVEAFPGREAQLREIPLNSGYPLVRWRATEGLAQVYRWLDEGRDLNAWIDLEVHVTNALNSQDVQTLRRSRERIVNIRPVFPTTEQIVSESRSQLPLEELFRRFYKEKTGGAEAEIELVALFLDLIHAQKDADTLETDVIDQDRNVEEGFSGDSDAGNKVKEAAVNERIRRELEGQADPAVDEEVETA